MSKAVIKSEIKNQIVKPAAPLPAVREVNSALIPAIKEQDNNVIAVYKDLNQPAKDFALRQQRHVVIGFFVFLILGLGIMMGQHFSRSRGLASAEMVKLVPAGVAATSEHYHYDKSCYMGADGEQVCMTRTSQQR